MTEWDETANRPGNGRNNPLLARLRWLTPLDEAPLAAVAHLCEDVQSVRARTEIVPAGEASDRLHVLLDGWACRYAALADGRRQMTQILLPGDICDLDTLHFGRSGQTVAALTVCSVASMRRSTLAKLAAERADVGAAFGWLAAVESAGKAERIACLGRRSARAHLAHLICELLLRLTIVGRADGHSFVLSITQEDIADALGLTAVHVNRVMQGLRADELIEQRGHTITVRDWRKLRREAEFRPDYLHLEGMAGTQRNAPWAAALGLTTSPSDRFAA